MSDCGCEIHEEVHYELPDQPVEYIVLYACTAHASEGTSRAMVHESGE